MTSPRICLGNAVRFTMCVPDCRTKTGYGVRTFYSMSDIYKYMRRNSMTIARVTQWLNGEITKHTIKL